MTRLPTRASSRGFTLIECLVAITIIGMLAALLLVAVQQSREAARRMSCASHLREIGLALAAHQGTYGVYPSSMRQPGAIPAASSPASAHSVLLPYLDQAPLFNSLNLELARFDSSTPVALNIANHTAATVLVNVFLCPSDAGTIQDSGRPVFDRYRTVWFGTVANSYRACNGPHPNEFEGSRWPGGGGAFPGFLQLPPADFRDGLSVTAGFSERLIGSSNAKGAFQRNRDVWFSNLQSTTTTSNGLRERCGQLNTTSLRFETYLGRSWLQGELEHTIYNHVAPPNWSSPDCSSGGTMINAAAITARSAHPGGVNVMMMDGSVRFIMNGVAPKLWLAMATRSGSEVVVNE